MRFIKSFTTAWAALLAACGSAPPAQAPATGAQPATVSGAAAASHQSGASRNWEEYKLRAARRIHEQSTGLTFDGPLPDPLQSIPVLQVQLHRDGSIRNIVVLRTPRFAPQTIEMAMLAIRRAAPFEPVGHLPQPWQFSETFLYNDDLKFQLRTLAEATQ